MTPTTRSVSSTLFWWPDCLQLFHTPVKHTPIDKVYDACISLLAGAHGLVEINTRLRADPALQKAFGREPLCRAIGGAGNPGSLECRECEPNGTSAGHDLSPPQSRVSP